MEFRITYDDGDIITSLADMPQFTSRKACKPIKAIEFISVPAPYFITMKNDVRSKMGILIHKRYVDISKALEFANKCLSLNNKRKLSCVCNV